MLVLLGQTAYSRVPMPERGWLILLILIGATAFLAAGQIAVRRQVPQQLRRPVQLLTGYFNIRPGQLILLGLAFCFSLMASLTAGREFLAWHFLVSVIAWLLGIIFVISGAQELDAPAIHLQRRDFIMMAVLFAAAFLLRGLATEQIPTTFSGDEGSAGLNAVAFAKGEFNNLFTFGWFSFPSFYFAVEGAFVAFFGQTVEALRLSSALAGALTVIAVYWLGRVLFGQLTGILAGLYLALSHYHIHMSRIALNNIWDGLFSGLALAGLWSGWKSGRRTGFILSGLALGFGQYFYVSIRVLPILFIIWALIAWFTERETFRQRLPGLLLAAYAALIVALPLLILFARHPDEFNAPLNRVTMLGDQLEGEVARSGKSAVQIIGDQMRRTALGFTNEPLRLLYEPGTPLLLPLAATLFLLGIFWGILHFDLRYLLLFLPLIATILTGSISTFAPASQRYVMVMPVVAVLVAVPLAQLAGWLQEFWPDYRRAIRIAVVALMVFIGLLEINFYFRQVYDHYVLGGVNTVVATEVADFLKEQGNPRQDVYFFGFPRMGYFSHSTIPYLAPDMTGHDVAEPITSPPDWGENSPIIFIFLPERLNELSYVTMRYPDGAYREFKQKDGSLLFAVYQIGI